MNAIWKLSLAALLPLALLGGCDDSSEKKTAEEKRLEDYLKSQGVDADVKLDGEGNGASVAIKTESGGVTGTGGSNLSLPGNFPKDVPSYPGANIFTTSEAPDMGVMLQAQSEDAPDKVAEFYKTQMAANGWTANEAAQSPYMKIFSFEKGARKAHVSLIPNGSGTTLQITAPAE